MLELAEERVRLEGVAVALQHRVGGQESSVQGMVVLHDHQKKKSDDQCGEGFEHKWGLGVFRFRSGGVD